MYYYHYDSKGNMNGYSESLNGKSYVSHYDKGDNLIGFSVEYGDHVREYRSNGIQSGYSRKDEDGIVRHYDNDGKMTGYSIGDKFGVVYHCDSIGNRTGSSSGWFW